MVIVEDYELWPGDVEVLEALDRGSVPKVEASQGAYLVGIGLVRLEWEYSGYSTVRYPHPYITVEGRRVLRLAKQEEK
jgi:hypothetical protein